jgi:Ca-activated chloride channel homolog
MCGELCFRSRGVAGRTSSGVRGFLCKLTATLLLIVLTTAAAAMAQSNPAETAGTVPGQATEQAAQQAQPGIPQSAPESSASPQAPAAMASRSKLPPASDYGEVHVQPQVSSEEKAKFDPNSTAAVESGVDPKLRTHTKPIRVDVDMVLVPVSVTDPADRPILGLDRENFVVLDNGQKQNIESFSCEDAPVSIGILLDTSGSMHGKIDQAREAIGEFLKTANPEDEFFLISFADRPAVVSDFTTNVDELQNRLAYTPAKGRTALLDAIYLGVAKMRHARQRRKALMILSDGGDNRSRYTENEIRSLVREADVQIYAIGIFDANPRSHEEEVGPILLSDITDVTGGRTYTLDNPKDLSNVADKISLELRNQYVLGYRPSNPGHDGKWRKVRVKLSAPKGLPPLSVYAKMGYYAPSD